jgi:hypothetical protein
MQNFPFGDVQGGVVGPHFGPFRLTRQDQSPSEGHLAVLSHIATLPQMVYPIVFAPVGEWNSKPADVIAKETNAGSAHGTTQGSSPGVTTDWRCDPGRGLDPSSARMMPAPVRYMPSLILNPAAQPLYVSRVQSTHGCCARSRSLRTVL